MAVFLSCYARIKSMLPNYRDECKYISKVNVLIANFQNMVVFVDFYMNARKGFK